MDNSERGGSLKNIHAHYDLSNDLFKSFLDKETLMYSSAIYDAVAAPPGHSSGLVFRGSLEQAQWRKLDTLLDRAQIKPGQTMLDIGFGWGGLSIHAAKKYGCKVTGITLSVEQMALATERVKKRDLITSLPLKCAITEPLLVAPKTAESECVVVRHMRMIIRCEISYLPLHLTPCLFSLFFLSLIPIYF